MLRSLLIEPPGIPSDGGPFIVPEWTGQPVSGCARGRCAFNLAYDVCDPFLPEGDPSSIGGSVSRWLEGWDGEVRWLGLDGGQIANSILPARLLATNGREDGRPIPAQDVGCETWPAIETNGGEEGQRFSSSIAWPAPHGI